MKAVSVVSTVGPAGKRGRVRSALCSVLTVFFLFCANPIKAETPATIEDLINEHSAVMLIIEPASGEIVTANMAATEFYGYSFDQLTGLNISDLNILSPEQVAEERRRAQATERNYFIFPHQLASGVVRTVEVHSSPFQTGDGQSLLFSVIQDITDQRVAELSLQAYEDDLEQLVIQRTEEAMAARALLDQALLAIAVAAVLALTVISYFLWQNRRLLKKERAARSDVLMLDAQAYELTFFDSLTGLPNRHHILSKLKDALQASRSGQAQFALMMIDLDHFKNINDSYGHDAGDWLLKSVTARLHTCIGPTDTLARLGGDEFLLLVDVSQDPGLTARQQAADKAEWLRQVLIRPYIRGSHEHHCSPSIGITVITGRHVTEEDALKQAELALYKAKSLGRNTTRFFDPQMQADTEFKADLEQAMRQGLRNGEFELHYQVQTDDQQNPRGAEALLRWHNDTLGNVPPGEFIPVAENSGLINELGDWVLSNAFQQLQAWRQLSLPADFSLSINISPLQFLQRDFTRRVAELLDHYDVDPAQIKFELTETALLEHMEDAAREMTLLQTSGIRFALDDFGTGYSSLSYLKRLPLVQLKIDKSFVMDVINDPNDAAIARSIIGLGQNLGLSVIAEGVETEAVLSFLKQAGCPEFQGFYLGRPMAADQFEQTYLGVPLPTPGQ